MQIPSFSAQIPKTSVQFGARYRFDCGTEGRANDTFQGSLAASKGQSEPTANFKLILEPDSNGNMTIVAQDGAKICYADGMDAKGFLRQFLSALENTTEETQSRLTDLWKGFWLTTEANDMTEALSNLTDTNQTA